MAATAVIAVYARLPAKRISVPLADSCATPIDDKVSKWTGLGPYICANAMIV